MIFLPLLIFTPLVWFLLSPEKRDRIPSVFTGRERRAPLDTAREHYAAGEITWEWYRR
jgi:uncharacterized membrane protein